MVDRFAAAVLLLAVASGTTLAAAPLADGLLRHCGSCHADGAAEGGLDLGRLLDHLRTEPVPAAGPDHAAWVAVWRNLRAGTMPPADAPQPDADERRALVGMVQHDVLGVDPDRPDPGRAVLRRLTRREYANTVRDLTGLAVDDVVADLPPDDGGHGFDTVGASQGMSPLLVEKYVGCATRLADALLAAAGGREGRPQEAYPPALARVFPLGPPPDPAARADHLRATIERLAERGFRRPVEPAVGTALFALARSAMEAPGGGFEHGVAAALGAVLSSPRFLFRLEGDAPDGERHPGAFVIDEHALATRLSYLLWSSMPDDELFALARAGRLRAELPRQVERLIADPRADEFARQFVGQWLRTADVEGLAFAPDTVRPPRGAGKEQALTAKVRRAMRAETELLFLHLLRANLPASELLVGPRTFLNEPLARFYGIADVSGPEMRLVDLPAGSDRGGLLAHGSFLAVTSGPARTSPVKRGQFILANLLGTPVPPPPPDVPPLAVEAEERAAAGGAGMREALASHRGDPACASCHARMDPLGLALEHYDPVGRRREPADAGSDTSGRLATGESFAGPRELAALIAGPRRRDFHRCLTEKLLVYALGRGLEYADAPAVDTIVDSAERDGRLQTLVQGVVASVPFQMRRPPVGRAESTKRESAP